MNKEPIQIAKETKPEVHCIGDAFGSMHIMLDGRAFITINYIAPWIDNAGMRGLSEKIMAIVKGEEGPSCAKDAQ